MLSLLLYYYNYDNYTALNNLHSTLLSSSLLLSTPLYSTLLLSTLLYSSLLNSTLTLRHYTLTYNTNFTLELDFSFQED